MPGRRTPGRNILAFSNAEATIAPVFPADTTALTSPAASKPQHFEIELSRFLRRASTGLSSIPMTWLACTTGKRSSGASEALPARRRPGPIADQHDRRALVLKTASTAPATIGPGA